MRHACESRAGGVAAEFALVVPVLLLLVLGLVVIDTYYFADAGVQHAIGEGARRATLFPRATDAAIIARIQAAGFGLNPTNLQTPTVTRGTANGLDYVDIRVVYLARLNTYPFKAFSVTIEENRRVYLP